jgi:DNA-binding CsgD family transcriptional regulator
LAAPTGNTPLLAAGSGLAAESPAESATLQALISQAVSTSQGDGLSAGGGLQISRKSGVPLNVVVSPVRGLATDFRETVRAVVYVTDPSLRIRPRNELLQTIFGLTPAECRIALLIADGMATSAIREMTGITANTLRTHLASIYRKTNTARQTHLVKLINLIGVAGPPSPE